MSSTTQARRSQLYLVLCLTPVAIFVTWFIINYLLVDWHWNNEPFHATAEAIGGLAAILMALFLFQKKQNQYSGEFALLATGFLSMGLLDTLHGVTHPGIEFVFLHSLASLAGGFCFMLIWLPRSVSLNYYSARNWVVWVVAILTTLFGLGAMQFPELLPPMIHEGEFTTAAITINILAGVLFLLAIPRLVINFNHSGKTDFFLFFCLALLFGLAELTFQYSVLWDGGWWIWHLLRLLAYLVALWFVARGYMQMTEAEQLAQKILQNKEALENTVAEYVTLADRVRAGDLSNELILSGDQDDPLVKLGRNINIMINNLRNLIRQVQQSSDQVANASRQLNATAEQTAKVSQQVASVSQQVAQGAAQQSQSIAEATNNVTQTTQAAEGIAHGAQEQAQAVQTTSTSINEMANIVGQVGQVAASVTEANASVTQAASHGVTAVAQTSQGMETIRSRTAAAAKRVKEMGVRSKEIGRIVETIDTIADKTDMLALNAAVEAARAGEYGRGFAVVAEHVRKLSEDSKEATRDIDDLIERVQETVNEAVTAMEHTVAEVDHGAQLAKDTTQSLQEIMQAAEGAANLTQQINGSVAQLRQKSEGIVTAIDSVGAVVEENTSVAEEMAAGSQETTDAMENVVSIATQNSASIEEVSASAEEMSAQVEEVVASSEELSALAEELRAATSQFQVTETGQTEPGRPGSPTMTGIPSRQHLAPAMAGRRQGDSNGDNSQ